MSEPGNIVTPVEPGLLHARVLFAVHAPHAFTTRAGGVSKGVFASLNFGNPGELSAPERDPGDNIRENFRRVMEAMGVPERRLIQVHQVHGAGVVTIPRDQPLPAPGTPDPKADAIVTNHPGIIAAVRVADCAPVLLASRDGTVVGAVHAGWRGVVLGTAVRAVEAMRSLGAAEIVAAIGPCIGPTRFEVGGEVVEAFSKAGFDAAAISTPAPGENKAFLDLPKALRIQLEGCGIAEVEVLEHCTACESDRFFSHRRDRGLTGRMAALIACRG